jgi:predicted ATPase
VLPTSLLRSRRARESKNFAACSRVAVSDPSAIPLLAELLSIPAPGETALLPVPAQRKAAIIALLVDEIVRLSDADPVLLILEDAHWIDATTLELMTRLIDSIGSARLLAVVTARPEFAPPWQARQHSTLLTLSRLGRTESSELASGIAASHGLSDETIDAIVAKTDGVPLFVEELTKAVLESAADGDGRGRDASCPAPPAQVPACVFHAPGSYRRSDAVGIRGLAAHSSSDA